MKEFYHYGLAEDRHETVPKLDEALTWLLTPGS